MTERPRTTEALKPQAGAISQSSVQHGVLDRVLPRDVVRVELFGEKPSARLLAGEETLVAGAIASRRSEFSTARWCAHEMLARLGLEAEPLLADEHGAPRWPSGVVGSITHCAGYRASAGVRRGRVQGIGIDAERHRPLPASVRARVGRLADEVGVLSGSEAHARHWETIVFCAKEATHKAWYSFARERLRLADTEMRFEERSSAFSAELSSRARLRAVTHSATLTGRWAITHGLVIASAFVT